MTSRVALVGFAESLAAIEAAWDLLDNGFTVHAFTRRGRRPALARDKRVHVHAVSPPEERPEECLQQIMSVAARLSWPLLMPLDDVSLWALAAIASREPRALVAGPTGDLADFCLDKRRQLSAAADAGLSTPPTLTWPGSAPALPSFGPPWIVKPALALDVSGGRVSKGRTQFAGDSRTLHHVLASRTDPLLVQPVLRGTGHGLFGHAVDGKVRNWSAHERIRMMNPAGSGSSACRSVDPPQELLKPAALLIEQLSWNGIFMLEFLRDPDGVSWFMEMNGRAWGSLVLATRRGLHYPTWGARSALDRSDVPREVVPGPHLTARHIGREILHLGFVARDRYRHRSGPQRRVQLPASAEETRVAASVRDVLRWHRSDRPYNFRKGQAAVLVADTVDTWIDRLRA